MSYGKTTLAVELTLSTHGPMTVAQLREELGMQHKGTLTGVLHRMRQKSDKFPKRIYISAWVHEHEGARRYPRAVYSIGDKRDKPKPKPLSDAVKAKRRRGLRVSRLRHASVFNLGLTYKELGL